MPEQEDRCLKISMKKYNKKMDAIISKKLSVVNTLIMMLEEASKYKIKGK